jgi:hypothetical protein
MSVVEEPIDIDFAALMPSMTKLFRWLICITVGGIFLFPFFALTLESQQ